MTFYFALLYQFYVGARSEFGEAENLGAATPLRVAIGIPRTGAPTPITDIDAAVDRLLQGTVVPEGPISSPQLAQEIVQDDYVDHVPFDYGEIDGFPVHGEVGELAEVDDVPRAWYRSAEIAARVRELELETRFRDAALQTERLSAKVVRNAMAVAFGVQLHGADLHAEPPNARKQDVLLHATALRRAYRDLQSEARRRLLDQVDENVDVVARNESLRRRQMALELAEVAYRAATLDTTPVMRVRGRVIWRDMTIEITMNKVVAIRPNRASWR